MKQIEYSSEQIDAVSDALAERGARDFLLHSDEEYIAVSTSNFITAVRVLIAEGVFPHDQVQFLYNNQIIQPDKDGRLPVWPEGFCDTEDVLISRIMIPNKTIAQKQILGD